MQKKEKENRLTSIRNELCAWVKTSHTQVGPTRHIITTYSPAVMERGPQGTKDVLKTALNEPPPAGLPSVAPCSLRGAPGNQWQ